MTWLTGWGYRKSHIVLQAAGAGTLYQTKIKVYYGQNTNQYFENDGAGTPISAPVIHPVAFYYNNRTYIVYAQTADLDSYITYFDHLTNTFATPVKVGDNGVAGDAHGDYAVVVDANGYIHVFGGCHNTAMLHWKSNSAENISAWTAQANIDADATYPHVIVDGSTMYVFFRTTGTTEFAYRKSVDNGATWGANTPIISMSEQIPYVGNCELINGKVYMAWCRYSNPSRYDYYCAYFDTSDGKMYSVGGTDLGTSIDLTEANASCKLYTGTDTNIGVSHADTDGNVYIIFQVTEDGIIYFKFAKWNGISWTLENITTTDSTGNVSDFIVLSSTSIEAYLTTAGSAGVGGDIEKWNWNGSTWSQTTVVLTQAASGRALCNPVITQNYVSPIKLIFSQTAAGATDIKLYAYSGTAFVPNIQSNEVYTDGHCKTDFGDIRFTDSSGNILLDCWLEEKTDSNYADFWVEISDNLTDGNSTIYIYYGKADATYPYLATDLAQGEATFLFFDNFDAASLDWVNKWLSTDQSLYSIEGGKLKFLKPNATTKLLNTKNKYTNGFAAECLLRQSVASQQSYFMGEPTAAIYTGKDAGVLAWNNYPANSMFAYINGASTGIIYVPDLTSYFKVKYLCPSSGNATITIYLNSTQLVTKSATPASTNVYITFLAWGGGVPVGYAENVFVRKYIASEPTHSGWGQEETAPPIGKGSSMASLMEGMGL
jgi:hypothetical protein